ncbi:hypothetical protein ABG067_004121 [Albugo candida]
MISLLEKEAQDPIEILRIKLRGFTEGSFINSHLLDEIKKNYLIKQRNTKGKLNSFAQAHIDEIERASELLKTQNIANEICSSFNEMQSWCQKMQSEVKQPKLSADISIARRNACEVESQILFYQNMPSKLLELQQITEHRKCSILSSYMQWQSYDDWAQNMFHELQNAGVEKTDELGSSKAQMRILSLMSSRVNAIKTTYDLIMREIWGCMHNCIQIAQIDQTRLKAAFEVLDLMEERRKRVENANRDTLDSQLQVVADSKLTWFVRCEKEIIRQIVERIEKNFRNAENNAIMNKKSVFDASLEVANNLMMDLEVVQADVAKLFPPEIDIIQLYTRIYTKTLEVEITKLCTSSDLGMAQRLQLVQWIEFFNTEILNISRARTSVVLDENSSTLMNFYLTQIQSQIHIWITNIWQREEDHVAGPNGELQSTRPNDIVNIIKSQISIGQEWLTGKLLGRVVMSCLKNLLDELTIRYKSIVSDCDAIDIDVICSFINDTDVLQAKCPEVVQEIYFGEKNADEKIAFDAFIGDQLDVTSSEIVKLAMCGCELITKKIFAEMENDTFGLWLSKKWDEGDPVVESLLATLADYFEDLQKWISGVFFFSKIVRFCLERCQTEYHKRILARMSPILHSETTATLIESDFASFIDFFAQYETVLGRTGLRSRDAIEMELSSLQVAVATLRRKEIEILPTISSDALRAHQELVRHIQKLMPSSLEKEAAGLETVSKSISKKKKSLTSRDKQTSVDKKAAKEREKAMKEREKAQKAAAAAEKALQKAQMKANQAATKQLPPTEKNDFDVQSLNMDDFLGTTSP